MATNQPPNPYIQKIHKDDLDIRKEIGRGSFGIVYLAYDQNRHHWCAVKCLTVPSDFSSDEKHNLEAEADKMFRVRDDHVIDFFGLCIDAENGICGLAMPYMRFGSLQRLLSRHGLDLPWSLRIRIMYQAARGMNALHLLEPKVLHLDLKSGNILLTDNLEVKVADFGLSRMRRETSRSHSTTKLTGTLSHTPPEYFENMYLRPTTKFDVYSYGVTVWEILTRQQPYTDVVLNEHSLSACIRDGQRPNMDEIHPDVDSKYEVWTTLKDLMFGCWAQEPAERPEFMWCTPLRTWPILLPSKLGSQLK